MDIGDKEVKMERGVDRYVDDRGDMPCEISEKKWILEIKR